MKRKEEREGEREKQKEKEKENKIKQKQNKQNNPSYNILKYSFALRQISFTYLLLELFTEHV